MKYLLFFSIICATNLHAAEQKRCGWYENPTPANHWLTDSDGIWTLITQGGRVAPGFHDLPSTPFNAEWVSSNGEPGDSYYGYGCACIDGVFDIANGEILRLTALTPQTLNQCRNDINLPPEPNFQ